MLHALEVHQAELEVQNLELIAANEELVRINAELTVAHGRFLTLYQRAPTPFVTIDRDGAIVEMNWAAELLLGASSADLAGTTLSLFFAEASRGAFRRFVDGLGGDVHAHEAQLHRRGAEPVDVLIDGLLLREAPTDPPRVILAIVDVTALKRADAVRRRAQDEMLGIVSHDLGGPLHAISLACDAMLRELEGEIMHKQVGRIQRSVARCGRLIRDLLGVVHIESGQLSLRFAPLDLGALVLQLANDLEPSVTAAGGTLRVSVAEALPTIDGDADRLIQVISNLINNARTHARGASVDVVVTHADDDVVIVVADDGPGISAEELPRVFERYRQGQRHRGGAGLGLAIVKGLVEAHHGSIVVLSELGHGARFEVTLPISQVL